MKLHLSFITALLNTDGEKHRYDSPCGGYDYHSYDRQKEED